MTNKKKFKHSFDDMVKAATKLNEALRALGDISPDPDRKIISIGAGTEEIFIFLQNGNKEVKKKISDIANKETPGFALKFVASGPIYPL